MTETKIQLFESFYWFDKEAPPYFYKKMPKESEEKNTEIIKQMFENNKGSEKHTLEFADMFTHTLTSKGMDTPINRVEKADQILYEHIISQVSDTNKPLFEMYHKIHTNMLQQSYIPKPLTMEVLFFPSYDNESKLLDILDKTCSTLDICVYNLTNHQISKKLAKLHSKGVAMRMITDDQTRLEPNSLVQDIVKLGVPVREDGDPQSNMHHKFAIIDNIVVLTGSFNWTTMAAHYNEENVIIIGDKNIVKQYNAEFSKLWKFFEQCPVTNDSKHKAYSKPY